ncbi:predicted protein [Histoplasma mississippiense (nom. inval.)]|uniref:predicted protein n=1 Tax=Ajellomyces capsulatus (strain NAm1 / WU24) TaxID=2059318 RepID=UPI000157B7B2|nr:predicted protein [Histoplasma mississippiense (nom. inval.)]EDN03906.1 predicted protein [Histoplasma mississippiense (nom. inval.)]
MDPSLRLHDVEIIEIDDDDDDDDEDEDEDDNLEDDLDDDDEDDDDEDEEEDQEEDDMEEEDEENEEEDDMTGTDSMEERSSDFEETEQGNVITISSGLGSPSLLATSNIQQVINPLRNTADRVASQIEAFAQNLNQFKQHTRASPGDPEAFREACKLVQKYQKIAETSAKELSTTSTSRKAKQSAINRGSGANQGSNGRLDEQIRRWQLEAETWELLLQMLSIDDPESRARAQRAQQTVFQSLHRYSSDQEVWNKFLEADHFALENFVVLKWLEKTARSSPQDIDGFDFGVRNPSRKRARNDYDRGHNRWNLRIQD